MLETTRQKELLGTTLACIGDGVIVTDVQERVTFLNGEAARLTGWKPDEAIGRPVAEVFCNVSASTRKPAESRGAQGLLTGLSAGFRVEDIAKAPWPTGLAYGFIRVPSGQSRRLAIEKRDPFLDVRDNDAIANAGQGGSQQFLLAG